MRVGWRAATTALAIVLGVGFTSAQADGIDKQCLVTYNVREEMMALGETTVPCATIEEVRAGVLNALLKLEGSGDAVKAQRQAEKVARVREKVLGARSKLVDEGKTWSIGLATQVATLVTLATCGVTTGGACLMPAVYALISSTAVIFQTGKVNDKARELGEMMRKLKVARKALAADTAGLTERRARLVDEFNELCAEVRRQCVPATDRAQ